MAMGIADLSAYHRLTADLLDISTALQGIGAPQPQQAFGAPKQDMFQTLPFGQQLGAAPAGQFDVNSAINSIIQVFQQLLTQMGGGQRQAVGGYNQAGPIAPPALPAGGAPVPGAPALPAAGAPAPGAGGIPLTPVGAQGGFTPVPNIGFTPVPNIQGPLDQGKMLTDTGNLLVGVGQILISLGGNGAGMLSSPSLSDAGGVKQTGASAVATSGGYEIKALGPAEWSITDPKTGKSTRIHGDPHVSESDGKNWDFKQDSTFQLADGTHINVKTADAGNGTTVTDALEVISGNGQRAVMSGMKGGIGKVESVDFQPEQFRTGQTFVMGKEADDWALADKGTGRQREIMASNGADHFQLGNDLEMAPPPQANVKGQFVPNGPQNAMMGQGGNTAQPVGAAGTNALAPAGGGIEALLGQIQQILGTLGGGQKQLAPAPFGAPVAPPAQALMNPMQAAQMAPQGQVMSQLLGAMAQMLNVLVQSFSLGRGLNQNKPPLAV